MQQHIGGTKAMAWAGNIMRSISPQVKRARELKEFNKKLQSLFDLGEPLDMTTRRRMEAFFGYDLSQVRIHRGWGVEDASRRLGARAFTLREHIFAPHQSLDVSTTEGLGLLAHELTHTIQQTHPHQLPQGQMANRDSGLLTAASEGHSTIEMVLLAPTNSSPLTTNPQLREAQAQASEQLVAGALADNRAKSPPEINREEVASRVLCLMQDDLRLDREEGIKLGG